MYVCMYVCMHACMHVRVCVCVCVCVCVFECVCTNVYTVKSPSPGIRTPLAAARQCEGGGGERTRSRPCVIPPAIVVRP